MTLLGGALVPMLQGALIDTFGVAISYAVPGVCFLAAVAYGLFDLRSTAGLLVSRSAAQEVPELT
ncbi:hypothetical protein ACFS3C_07985 [Azotobacter vinelandii]|uniref:sugar MFS transporter n=1 Tax=Azotobacter TaxID=352 RepID=UPI001181ACE6|nr:sugar MFS transporter [Azotobacter vinelandii]